MAGQTRRIIKRIPVIAGVKALEASSIFTATGALVAIGWPLWFPEEKLFRGLPRIAALAEMLALVELSFFCEDQDRLSPERVMGLMRDVTTASVRSLVQVSAMQNLGDAEKRLLRAMPASPIGRHLSLQDFGGDDGMPPVAALAAFLCTAFEWLHELATLNGGEMSASDGFGEHLKTTLTHAFERRISRWRMPAIGDEDHAGGRHRAAASNGVGSSFDDIAAWLANDVAEGHWDGVIASVLAMPQNAPRRRMMALQ